MIPRAMEDFLRQRLPESTWQSRLERDGSCAYMEFGPLDVDRLGKLGIVADSLGPRLVVCMWDEESALEVGGYLVVDNLAMGRPSMGGIRKLPDLTPVDVYNLARGMTLKNAAAQLPFGGGKAGIVSRGDLSPQDHEEVIRRFARMIRRYRDNYLPGPDVGTNDADMKTVAIENGLDNALSKPVEMGGNRIDQLGAAGGGAVIALQALLEEMPALRGLPQFADLEIPAPRDLTVLIQGFGAVGAHAARQLLERLPDAKVIGISDETGYLYSPDGLPIAELFERWQRERLVSLSYARETLLQGTGAHKVKFSTDPNDLLRESAFCLIPAAPIAHYLDTEVCTRPSMTCDRMGTWRVIVEGANTYSPDPARRQARTRMERSVYRQRGVLIATDYLVNSGGVIFAAQEKLIKTPPELRIPDDLLGDRARVEKWLVEHAGALKALAEARRKAGEAARESAIRRNMHELVEALASDPDMLPAEAAERISVRRIASREGDRTAAEILEPIPIISASRSVQEAAAMLVDSSSPILAVVDDTGLTGVVTEWDITRATARSGRPADCLTEIMSREVVRASPRDTVLEIVRKLEYHEISAMPVVDDGRVLGMISADLLARRSLLRLLQGQSKD
ncbi:MAG TPA: Glu/Leu/Phe/Val dehydrogenase dimerization domain-containing protein [Anaerolineales bacterium]|nr:Glu/Leu/Phe/Val dehydrogenase dimerization domain-containing protein [Anaerolineales bacterium]